jgi:hypothetical protein
MVTSHGIQCDRAFAQFTESPALTNKLPKFLKARRHFPTLTVLKNIDSPASPELSTPHPQSLNVIRAGNYSAVTGFTGP